MYCGREGAAMPDAEREGMVRYTDTDANNGMLG